MELRHIRYFIAVVEEGSLQGAARRMHVAQPALSRQIRDLEDMLGCVLFERRARGVQLRLAWRKGAATRSAAALQESLAAAIEEHQAGIAAGAAAWTLTAGRSVARCPGGAGQ